MNEIEIRHLWQKEEPEYKQYGESLVLEIKNLLMKLGIYGEISFRTKETDSLIKKIYRKGKEYESINDKVGARVIIQFPEDLQSLDNIICQYFGNRIITRDDKATTMSEYEFGYQSIHYDIFDNLMNKVCELQIRTFCQHNWSMMSHALSYKSDKSIPISVLRQINALSALFEIADTQFQKIKDSIKDLPDSHAVTVLKWIESKFLSISNKEYDREMTNIFINILNQLYVNENIIEKLEEFYIVHYDNLVQSVQQQDSGVFYSQPEIIIILERLTNKKILLKHEWARLYPIEMLEDIASKWGCSIN
ncbi:MAG: hypothetical protein K8R73_11095 [Clostridiales bacterium]|nr:hypothetical protein [Clostridiales bacterium]